ncbi:MAG: hypothetical protein H7839_12660 [Magnetococcus sp. YQC-5]
MRLFYQAYPPEWISGTLSRKSAHPPFLEKSEAVSRIFPFDQLAAAFPLSWSHYVHLTL